MLRQWPPKFYGFARSRALDEQAKRLIPGANTASKAPSQFPYAFQPWHRQQDSLRLLVLGQGGIAERRARILRDMGHNVVVLSKADRDDYDGVLICGLDYSPPSGYQGFVFFEKPPALSLRDFDQLKRGRGESFFACNMEFHPGVQALCRQLAIICGSVSSGAGVRGGERASGQPSPVFAKAWFSYWLPAWRPGRDYRETSSAQFGPVWDSWHELRLVQKILQRPLLHAHAQKSRSGLLKIPVDRVHIEIQTVGAERGQVDFDYLGPYKSRGAEVLTSDGQTVRWESWGKGRDEHIRVWHMNRLEGRGVPVFEQIGYDPDEMYRLEMECWIRCIAGYALPPLDVTWARNLVQVLEEASS